MELILTNSFSINMIPKIQGIHLDWTISLVHVQNPSALIQENILIGNYIGHKDTDVVVRSILEQGGAPGIPAGKRETLIWSPGRGPKLLVAQYSGPRLPEGATALPEGATIEWWLVG